MKRVSSALQPVWQPAGLGTIPTAAGRPCRGRRGEPCVHTRCLLGERGHTHHSQGGPAGPRGPGQLQSGSPQETPPFPSPHLGAGAHWPNGLRKAWQKACRTHCAAAQHTLLLRSFRRLCDLSDSDFFLYSVQGLCFSVRTSVQTEKGNRPGVRVLDSGIFQSQQGLREFLLLLLLLLESQEAQTLQQGTPCCSGGKDSGPAQS